MMGLCLMGFGCGMIIIPVLPDMIEATEERYPETDMDQIHNAISGIFIAAQGLGETLGPILGSVFEAFYTFRPALDILALILLFFMFVYWGVCGRNDIFKKVHMIKVCDVEESKGNKVKEPLLNNSQTEVLDHAY